MVKRTLENDCAEMMLIHLVQKVMRRTIHFVYSLDTPDEQIDLMPAFIGASEKECAIWTSGRSKKAFEADLRELDRKKSYFVRSGTNGGAGHWQAFYYDEKKGGWVNYSTATNNLQMTNERGELTLAGEERMISPRQKWGSNQGERNLTIIEATNQNMIRAANFVQNFRLLGEEAAIAKVFAEQPDDFYPQMLDTDSLGHSGVCADSELPAADLSAQAGLAGSVSLSKDVADLDPSVAILAGIIDTLCTNIRSQAHGRKTCRNQHGKIALLERLRDDLAQESDFTDDVKRNYIKAIGDVCARRRNALHFWAQPHSVSEFEALLRDNNMSSLRQVSP